MVTFFSLGGPLTFASDGNINLMGFIKNDAQWLNDIRQK
jgi:hypothetical protein